MSNNKYTDFIADLFAHCGEISLKAMFGGYGIYKNAVIFGLIIDDEIYFKVNKSNMGQYVSRGSKAFSYVRKGNTIKMSYWLLPIDILESPEELNSWVQQSYNISLKTVKR